MTSITTHSETARRQPAPSDLDRSLVRGLAWTGSVKWITQLISWASTLIVARLLTPHDYGLMGMAMVYLGVIQLVNEFGLSAAIIQRRHLTSDQHARLGGLSVVFGLGWFALSVVLSGPIAAFFGEPAVRDVIIVLGITLIAKAVQVLPRALMARELRFQRLAWMDGIEAITLTAATLTLALLGFRYWALVLGAVAGTLMTTILALVWRPHRFAWPFPLHRISSEVTFGWHFLAATLTWYAYSHADFAVVGRMLGSNALGAYSIGWQLANIPVDRLSALMGRVTPPVFSAVQDNPLELRRYLAKLTEGLAFLTFPAAIGLALVADEVVVAMLGDRWRPAIVPLQLLALYGGLRSVMTLPPQILIATNRPKLVMQFNALFLLALGTLFVVGARWGTTGVALGWVIGYPLIAIPTFTRTILRHINMSWSAYWQALRPAVTGTAIMAAVVLATRAVTPPDWPPMVALALHVVAGVATYSGVVLTMHRGRVDRFLAFVGALRQ